MSTKQKYTKGFVTSKNGTTTGYRQMGIGTCLILLHEGAKASQTLMHLVMALSGDFTVYIPDSRGRGLSRPFGDNYGLEMEVNNQRPHPFGKHQNSCFLQF